MPYSGKLARSGAGTKTIVFLAAPGTQILDVAGPFQVFVRAAEIFVRTHPQRKPPYKVLLASTNRHKTVSTSCGLMLSGTDTFHTLRMPIDTLLVARRIMGRGGLARTGTSGLVAKDLKTSASGRLNLHRCILTRFGGTLEGKAGGNPLEMGSGVSQAI